MDTRKVASEYRLAKWAQRIQERQESGQSIKEYCAAEGVSRNTYFYWLKKLRQNALDEYEQQGRGTKAELIPAGWSKLKTIEAPDAKAGIDIEIKEYRVQARADTDTELLVKILRVLKTL